MRRPRGLGVAPLGIGFIVGMRACGGSDGEGAGAAASCDDFEIASRPNSGIGVIAAEDSSPMTRVAHFAFRDQNFGPSIPHGGGFR